MAFAVNKVILVGNLGKDPEIRTLENGTKLASFTIATTESYKDKEGNYQDQTEWHRIVAWRWLADLSEKNLKKGSKVYIEGKLSTRSYEQDGIQKYTTDIVAREIITMSRNEEGGSYNSPPPPTQETKSTAKPAPTTTTELDSKLQADSDDVDDLPF
jgi:single-strand DNA-binding protein